MRSVNWTKCILAVLILAIFIIDRTIYYKSVKSDNKNSDNIHHELVGGWEIDFGKVENLYNNHHIFMIPNVKNSLNNLKDYCMHKFNLNKTVSHKKHTHAKDPTHTYDNKVIDIEVKFEFYFLTAYDLIILNTLIIFIYTNSNILGVFFFLDLILRLSKNLDAFQLVNSINSIMFSENNKNTEFLGQKYQIFNILNLFFTLLCFYSTNKNKHRDIEKPVKAKVSNDDIKKESNTKISENQANASTTNTRPPRNINPDRQRMRSKSPSGRSKIMPNF